MGAYKYYKNYGRVRWERWPRLHETVIDRERDDRGPWGHGSIVHVDKENKQVMVKFFSPPDPHISDLVLTYDDNIFWDARDGKTLNNPQYVDLNVRVGDAHCDSLITYQYYSFDDLKWSSHVGGVGAWITRQSWSYSCP